jgi:hypothetical protein
VLGDLVDDGAMRALAFELAVLAADGFALAASRCRERVRAALHEALEARPELVHARGIRPHNLRCFCEVAAL